MSRYYLRITFCAVAILSGSMCVLAQKQIAPPPVNATNVEVQKWFAESLPKYASYKTRSVSLTVSDVHLDGCVLKFTQSKKAGVTTSITEGAKRTVSTSKDEIAIDLRSLTAEKIVISDYLYEDLQVLEIKNSPDEPATEMIVKRSAAGAIRSALAAAARLCLPPN